MNNKETDTVPPRPLVVTNVLVMSALVAADKMCVVGTEPLTKEQAREFVKGRELISLMAPVVPVLYAPSGPGQMNVMVVHPPQIVEAWQKELGQPIRPALPADQAQGGQLLPPFDRTTEILLGEASLEIEQPSKVLLMLNRPAQPVLDIEWSRVVIQVADAGAPTNTNTPVASAAPGGS